MTTLIAAEVEGKPEPMSEKDIPVMFRWETPWRPIEIEELRANHGLHPGRTRDINTVMGFVLGQAIKTYRADSAEGKNYSARWRRQIGALPKLA
jgi:hypothetical protein